MQQQQVMEANDWPSTYSGNRAITAKVYRMIDICYYIGLANNLPPVGAVRCWDIHITRRHAVLTGYGPLSLTGLREFDSHKHHCIIIYSTRRRNYRQSHHSDDKSRYDKSTTRLLSIRYRLQRLRLLRLLPLHRLPRERGRVGIFISLISSLANRLRSVGISI